RDKNEYITTMGRPDVARIKRDAEVAAAEADRDIAIKRAEATRASAVAKAQADQERVAAETASLAKQAEAERDLDIKKASYLEMTKKAQATADKAYEIETNDMQQKVMEKAERGQPGEGGSQSHEHQGGGFPGIQPGRGYRQAVHWTAGCCARSCRAAQQSGQSDHRLHGQR